MRTSNDNRESDSRLVKLIQLLHPVPERNPRAIEQGRQKFLDDLDELFPEPITRPAALLGWIFNRERMAAAPRVRSGLALTTVMIVVTLVVFLTGGAGLTVYAAQKALPGDALYPVKTRFEQTRINLTTDHYRLATIQLGLAQERLNEIEALIEEKRFDLVANTAAEFEHHIQLAIEAVHQLANEDPDRASQLSARITDELNRYTQALNAMVNKLPDEVKAKVEESINNSPDMNNPQPQNHGETNENDQKPELNPEQGNANTHDNLSENENENVPPTTPGNTNAAEASVPGETNQNQNLNEGGDRSEFSFTGKVEKISPEAWMVNGTEFTINLNTKIEPGITVGANVEIEAWLSAGHLAQAIEIKLKDEDNNNEGANSNINQSSVNQNSNEAPSGNANSNTNVNSNENHNTNETIKP